ncbi:septum formation initiator family protein [Marinilongibacter aquaticus]|uniref:FtsB family cell division protein n=1 Tax=Marinilongibacter aquaticus TaxID=2975157 RepID=UPI0021BD8115|nr:septum formation initiator family protein [Marinilongibacter aquaticus]UBM59812.1 septum formation initiator family protein [Marinilongibacter aquaticus]
MDFDYKSFFKKYGFYAYTTLFFLLWLGFFDGARLITQIGLWHKLNKLEDKLEFYDTELAKLKVKEKSLWRNQDALEKFGREHFLMKKEGETVFVIVDEDGELMEELD